MADRITWIKNLLSMGTPAEQAAVRDVRQHAILTGNEKIIFGDLHGPADLSETLQNTGTNRAVEYPTGYRDFKQKIAQDKEMSFQAHSHPGNSTVTPSIADLEGWANNHYVPDLNKQGTYLPRDKYARDTMWIAGAKDPNTTLMVEPMPYSTNYADTYEMLRKLRENDTRYFMKLHPNAAGVRDPAHAEMSQRFFDFGKPWLKDMSRTETNVAFDALNKGLMLNQHAKTVPMHLDPAGNIVRGHDLPVGDVYPEWFKYLENKGDPVFKAEGGEVEGFQQGGWYNEPPDRYSVSPSQFTAPRGVTTPTFNIPIGKGEATAGFSYDPESRMIDAILGYDHPLGKRGAKFGVQGNFNKDVGPYGNEAPSNWGISGRLTLPFAEGGEVESFQSGGQKAAAIRAALAAFDKTPKTEGYVYHATSVPRLHDIAEEGLRTHKPWEHTDQGAWPDGSVRKRAYFANSPQVASSFSPEDGPPALLRTMLRKGIERESTGDFYSHRPIKRDDLEWLDTNGAWNPLKLWSEGE